jgi:hypothetical protein
MLNSIRLSSEQFSLRMAILNLVNFLYDPGPLMSLLEDWPWLKFSLCSWSRFSQVWIYHWVPVLLWLFIGFVSSFIARPGRLVIFLRVHIRSSLATYTFLISCSGVSTLLDPGERSVTFLWTDIKRPVDSTCCWYFNNRLLGCSSTP